MEREQAGDLGQRAPGPLGRAGSRVLHLPGLACVGTPRVRSGHGPGETDPVLAALAELGGLSAVADRLGFASDEDARQAIHAALGRSDQDTPAAGYGDLLDLDGPAAEV